MSGIVAYAGRQPAAWLLLDALGLLELREAATAGVAIWRREHDVAIAKSVGRVRTLDAKLRRTGPVDVGHAGIGHTDAMPALPAERNAGPLADCTDRVLIAHLGVVENAPALHRELEDDGHAFLSDVDSEIVAHLVEVALETEGSLPLALDAVRARLTGRWALVVLDADTGDLAATAQGLPLIVADGDDGVLLASDVAAIARTASSYRRLEDGGTVAVVAGVTQWWRDGAIAREPERRLIG